MLKARRISAKETSPLRENSILGLGAATPTSVLETARTFEVVSPVMIKSVSKANESLYFGDAVENGSEKVIGYVRVILSKDSYYKEILALVDPKRRYHAGLHLLQCRHYLSCGKKDHRAAQKADPEREGPRKGVARRAGAG